MLPNLSVIIMTYNEENNLAQALSSLDGCVDNIYILDSGSTDKTVEIADRFDCKVYQNKFENYAKQRNYALDNLPIDTKWVLFLDADEWLLDELKNEITTVTNSEDANDGYYINRRMIWMGKWIKRGYYPIWILRLFKYGQGRCEDRQVNEHIVVEGEVGYLKNDFMHEDLKPTSEWAEKHVRYANQEAEEELRRRRDEKQKEIEVRFLGSQAERKRWIRYRVWNRLPLFIRPFMFFFYRYILSGGFLDGKPALIYHLLHALWFPMLIDIRVWELIRDAKNKAKVKVNNQTV